MRNYYYDHCDHNYDPNDPVRKGDAQFADGCAALVATCLGSFVWFIAFIASFGILGIPGAVCFALFVGVTFVCRLYTAKATTR